MRILLINDYGTPSGGAEIITLGLRDELRRRGHEVRFFASAASSPLLPRMADDECLGTTGSWRTLLQCANFAARASLKRILQRFRPDVVHVNLYLTQLSPLILPLLRSIPTVYYAQWYRAVCPLGTRRLRDGSVCRKLPGLSCLKGGCLPLHDWAPLQIQRYLDERWRGVFRETVAISQAVAHELARYGGPAFQKMQVIHAGTPRVAEREFLAAVPTIVFAGRLVKEKGGDVLLQAFALALRAVPHARLVIAGDGPSQSHWESLTASLGIASSVEFMGQMSNRETTSLMRTAWCLCVPSLWEEPYGLVAAEAQMNGVAVVASRCGGLTEIIREGDTGLLFEPGNVEALAKCLSDVLMHRELAARLGQSAHRHAAACLSMEHCATRFEEVYRHLTPTPLNSAVR